MSAFVLELNGHEFEQRIKDIEFAIVPFGSVEYHGPHASLGTDTALANGLSERLSLRFRTLVFPPITYTFTPHTTASRPGSLWLSPTTMLAYVYEVLKAVRSQGIDRIFALNAHSENQHLLRLAAEQLCREHPEVSVLYLNWWKLVPPLEDKDGPLFSEGGGHGHGGPLEISAAASIDSSGFDPAQGKNIPYEKVWWKQAGQIVGRGQNPADWDGYHGKIDEIDLDKGRRIVEEAVHAIEKVVNDWLQRAGGVQER
jgi:creatinine amidohydrolase